MQIPVLAAIPSPATTYNNDDDNDKPNHLAALIALGGHIAHALEAIVEHLPTPTMEDNNNNDNNNDKEEMEEIGEL